MQELKNKKAIIVYGGFLSKGGGVVTHIKQLSPLLDEMGYSTSVFTMENIPIIIRYIPPAIEKFFNLLLPPLGYILRYKLTNQIYSHFLPQNNGLYIFEDLYLSTSKYGKLFLFFIHGFRSDQLQSCKFIVPKIKKQLVLWEKAVLIKYHEHAITVSDAVENQIETEFEINDVRIVYNYLYNEPKVSAKPRQNTVLFVGNLIKLKNPLFALEAFKKIPNNFSYSLKFIGNGPLYKNLRDNVDTHSNSNISLMGSLPHGQVLEQMASAKILLLPSMHEAMPFTLLEAKLSGLVTIITQGLGIPQQLADITLPLDSKLWSAQINKVLNSDNYKLFSKPNHEIQQFTRQNARQQLEQIIAEL
jgi:glycosyltransferase involved in cell wall biosynthesis